MLAFYAIKWSVHISTIKIQCQMIHFSSHIHFGGLQTQDKLSFTFWKLLNQTNMFISWGFPCVGGGDWHPVSRNPGPVLGVAFTSLEICKVQFPSPKMSLSENGVSLSIMIGKIIFHHIPHQNNKKQNTSEYCTWEVTCPCWYILGQTHINPNLAAWHEISPIKKHHHILVNPLLLSMNHRDSPLPQHEIPPQMAPKKVNHMHRI